MAVPLVTSPGIIRFEKKYMPLGNRTSLSLSKRWGHASGREFRMIPGLCVVMYEVFSEAFPVVLGNKGSCSFPFREHWKII